MMRLAKNGYVGLCYHYIRSPGDLFTDIFGSSVDDFCRHIELFSNSYQMISPDEAVRFSYGEFSLVEDKDSLLVTFDDGLSDHYRAACILAEKNIKAFFFIPTCVLADELPANPTIIHYCLAKYRITGFLKVYRQALEDLDLRCDKFNIFYKKGSNNPWETIDKIKVIFKYKFSYKEGRDVLLRIYKNLLLKEFPEALQIMHLTKEQVKSILEMGHSIGTHSHNHISMAVTTLSDLDFRKEILEPKKYLEKTFSTSVKAFSYPFGQKWDCFHSENLISEIKEYQLAFTIEKILNRKETCPLGLGRYMVASQDGVIELDKNIKFIVEELKKCPVVEE